MSFPVECDFLNYDEELNYEYSDEDEEEEEEATALSQVYSTTNENLLRSESPSPSLCFCDVDGENQAQKNVRNKPAFSQIETNRKRWKHLNLTSGYFKRFRIRAYDPIFAPPQIIKKQKVKKQPIVMDDNWNDKLEELTKISFIVNNDLCKDSQKFKSSRPVISNTNFECFRGLELNVSCII